MDPDIQEQDDQADTAAPALVSSVRNGSTLEGKKLSELFPPDERPGWRGCVEWNLAPERKKAAQEILKTKHFTPIPGLLVPSL